MLKFSIRRSNLMAGLLLCAHAGAAALLWPLDMPAWAKAVAGLAVLSSLAFFLLQVALLRTQEAVLAIEISEDGTLAVQTRRGDWHACRLSASSYVSPWLTILVLIEDHRRRARYVVITADSIEPEDFRRLRVWLRWAAPRIALPG